VLVQDGPDQPADIVAVPGGTALATSSTLSRRWVRDRRVLHHIVDPVTVFASTQLGAATDAVRNTGTAGIPLSTAALVRGLRAVGLLATSGQPARLVTAIGDVVRLNRWPTQHAGS
jgi:thiamine biosynthesis lipoprotein